MIIRALWTAVGVAGVLGNTWRALVASTPTLAISHGVMAAVCAWFLVAELRRARRKDD